MVRGVVGLNWGDEGKGRMVDYFAAEADVVVRFQGGCNAGHTVKNEKGSFAFHGLPSGVCYDHVQNVIAAGAVIDPEELVKEIYDVKKQLGDIKLLISDRAILTLPFHIIQEQAEEVRLADKKYGSTMSGIAPTYGDKYLKKGIQAGELKYPTYLKEHIRDIVEYKNVVLSAYGIDALDPAQVFEQLMETGKNLIPYIGDASTAVQSAVEAGKTVLLEAQLGALRDISHGIYPYTTSSPVLAGYACASIPLNPANVTHITGITKAYSTCVGDGPFVTEQFGPEADHIREVGNEYGAKTGRPRRIGWFDAVATRYGCRLQSAKDVTLTCLDVLTCTNPLPVCTGYMVNGVLTNDFPIYPALIGAKPVYKELPGWTEDITGVRSFDDLPENAKTYIQFIEDKIETGISCVSVGPNRDELFFR